MMARERCPFCNGRYCPDPERRAVCRQCGRSPGWQRPPTDQERDASQRKGKLGGSLAVTRP